MRIAILGCIHANLVALEAVLADAARAGVQRVTVAGDVVGWGPRPHETLAALRSRGIPSIRGHDDRRLVDFALDVERGEATGAASNVRWTHDRLDREDVKALASLPLSYGFTVEGRTVIVVHGTPRDEDAALEPDAPDRRLEAFLVLAGADILACAHGHRPFVRALPSGGLVVNVGSVGRPADGDPRPAYAVIELTAGAPPRAEIRRVEHDAALALVAAEEAGAPRRVRDELRVRAHFAARGEAARGLALLAPYRGPTTLARLARGALSAAARKLAEGSALEDPVQATHDVRVACRRALSALDAFSGMVAADAAATIARELRAILKGLSPVRDVDVGHALLEKTPVEDGVAAVALDAALESVERERGHAQELRDRALRRARRGALRRAIEGLARAIDGRGARTVPGRLATLAREAREHLDEALLPGSSERSIHEFRIGVKRLRYALEPFEPVDPAAAALATALGEAQDAIGSARDRSQLARRLFDEATRLEATGRPSLSGAVARIAQVYRNEADAALEAFRREGPPARVHVALELECLAAPPVPAPR